MTTDVSDQSRDSVGWYYLICCCDGPNSCDCAKKYTKVCVTESEDTPFQPKESAASDVCDDFDNWQYSTWTQLKDQIKWQWMTPLTGIRTGEELEKAQVRQSLEKLQTILKSEEKYKNVRVEYRGPATMDNDPARKERMEEYHKHYFASWNSNATASWNSNTTA